MKLLGELLWKTADGRMVKIEDMDDGHLLNSLRLVRLRTAQTTRYSTERKWKPYQEAMEAECVRRGLDTSNLTPDRIKVLAAKHQLAAMPPGPKPPPYEPPRRLVRKEE